MSRVTGFTNLPTYDDALSAVLERVMTLADESAPLDAAVGRVLREDIVADRDQPPFDRVAMDGFAVRSAEVAGGGSFGIVGEVAAGTPTDLIRGLQEGVVRIATGAAVPEPYDAVIQIEKAIVDGDRVTFEVDDVPAWLNVHRRGSDAKAGDVVIPARTRLGPQHVGLAAAVGRTELRVTRMPRVTLLSTGDEVRPPDTPNDQLEPQQIRNSNGPMLAAMLEALGVALLEHVHVDDDAERTLVAAREALSKSNLVLTTGGVSVGRRDQLPGAWKHLGLEQVIHGVAMRPGKPILVCQAPQENEKLVIGLPGNPVSVLATAHLFVRPVLRKMTGRAPALPWRRVWLAEETKPSAKRESFRAAKLVGETRDQARVLPWQGSGDLAHTAAADGFVRLPKQADALAAGSAAAFLPMAGNDV